MITTHSALFSERVPTPQRNLLARIIVGESTAPIWARPSLRTPYFGSLDSSNFITVDKPPASLWNMGISTRLLGFTGAVLGRAPPKSWHR